MLCPEEAEKFPSLPRISGFREPAGRPLVLSIPGPNIPWTAGPSPCEVRPSGLLGQLGNSLPARATYCSASLSPSRPVHPWVIPQHSSLLIAWLYAKHPIRTIPYTHYHTAWSRHHHEPILQMRKLRHRGSHTQQRSNRIGTQTQVCLTSASKTGCLGVPSPSLLPNPSFPFHLLPSPGFT